MDTATARDAEKPGTLGREKAEEKYQDASANYREIASQIAMRGPDRAWDDEGALFPYRDLQKGRSIRGPSRSSGSFVVL
jgi:hypothetical protein